MSSPAIASATRARAAFQTAPRAAPMRLLEGFSWPWQAQRIGLWLCAPCRVDRGQRDRDNSLHSQIARTAAGVASLPSFQSTASPSPARFQLCQTRPPRLPTRYPR